MGPVVLNAASNDGKGVRCGFIVGKKVGKAVVRAIRRDKSEILVAPLRQRRLASFAGRHPELAGRLTRTGRAEAIVDSVVEGQTGKR